MFSFLASALSTVVSFFASRKANSSAQESQYNLVGELAKIQAEEKKSQRTMTTALLLGGMFMVMIMVILIIRR